MNGTCALCGEVGTIRNCYLPKDIPGTQWEAGLVAAVCANCALLIISDYKKPRNTNELVCRECNDTVSDVYCSLSCMEGGLGEHNWDSCDHSECHTDCHNDYDCEKHQ